MGDTGVVLEDSEVAMEAMAVRIRILFFSLWRSVSFGIEIP